MNFFLNWNKMTSYELSKNRTLMSIFCHTKECYFIAKDNLQN